jgi:hypothetical protein
MHRDTLTKSISARSNIGSRNGNSECSEHESYTFVSEQLISAVKIKSLVCAVSLDVYPYLPPTKLGLDFFYIDLERTIALPSAELH